MIETIIKLLKKLQNNIEKYDVHVNKSQMGDNLYYYYINFKKDSDDCLIINIYDNGVSYSDGCSLYTPVDNITDMCKLRIHAESLYEQCIEHCKSKLIDFANEKEFDEEID